MYSTYSLKEIAFVVEREGLDLSIEEYIDPKEIKDDDLRPIWEAAKILLTEIRKKLDSVPTY